MSVQWFLEEDFKKILHTGSEAQPHTLLLGYPWLDHNIPPPAGKPHGPSHSWCVWCKKAKKRGESSVSPEQLLHSGTFCVARVARGKVAVHADHREHGHSPQQGAQLHYSPTPHEGAVALVTQDHPDDDLHVGQGENKDDPGQHLWSTRGWIMSYSHQRFSIDSCFCTNGDVTVDSQWGHLLRSHWPSGDMDSAPPWPLCRPPLHCPSPWEPPWPAEICEMEQRSIHRSVASTRLVHHSVCLRVCVCVSRQLRWFRLVWKVFWWSVDIFF